MSLEGLRTNFAVHIVDPLAGMAGAGAANTEALVVGDSGTDCDTFNMVAGARLPADQADAAITRAIALFHGRTFSWWLTSGDTPGDLGARLERAGLQRAETELAMACDLPAAALAPSDLTVRVVRGEADLIAYADVNHRNWEPPDGRVTAFYARAAARVLRSDSPFIYVIGEAPTGEIVAAGEGCLTGAVVGLYGISTLAAWRRRGYGAAICTAILSEAERRGARTAVLQASDEGAGLYRRLGFIEIGHCTEYKPL
jgi:ribosomal protein S18 acetylase RimI-like enzyme